jgi:hypothetical protein
VIFTWGDSPKKKKQKTSSIQWWRGRQFLWCELSFSLSVLFLSAFISARSTCKVTIISLEPCALNADVQSISFSDLINFLTLWTPLKDGFGGERKLKERVTLRIILVLTLTHPITFTQGHVSVFDKYLHWPCVSVKNIYICIYIYTATG